MQALVLSKQGDFNSIKVEEVADPKPKSNEIIVKHNFAGINFFDYAFAKGIYKLNKIPAILGIEGSGIISEIGSDVNDFKVGDRVTYFNAGVGAFAQKKAVLASRAIASPDFLTDDVISACYIKGLMAHTLLHKVCISALVKRILVQSATSGVGHILCQLAKQMNIEIIGTVGSDEKIEYARSIGCSYVINYRSQDLVKEVGEITDYMGVGISFDSVGNETLKKSIDCLWGMGLCVSFGETSGGVESFHLDDLTSNSVYLTRPKLNQYKASRTELISGANEIFNAVKKGVVRPKITKYNFNDIKRAFEDIENRKTTGSLVLAF